jgi:hypothetical protein
MEIVSAINVIDHGAAVLLLAKNQQGEFWVVSIVSIISHPHTHPNFVCEDKFEGSKLFS